MESERIAFLFDEAEERIADFKKETYADAFQGYLERNATVWNMISEAETGGMLLCEQEQAVQEIADAFTLGAAGKTEAQKSKGKRERMQYNLNLYMVSYVLPAILAWQKRCGIREEAMKQLTDAICDKWHAYSGTRIQASDFDSIQSGFKQKLCFVTTAVCSGLQKPQNCKEIILMKQFRDGYFLESAQGEQLIKEYYDIAPTIVKRIAREDNPEEKYQYLWNTYIRKCVDYIEQEQHEQCERLYRSMMSELKKEYMVTDRHHTEDSSMQDF